VTIFIIKKNNNNAFPLTTFARGHKVTAGCDVTTPARLPAPSWQRATFFERAIGSLEGPKGISRPTDAAAAAESPRLEDLTYIFCAAKFQISTSSAENLSWKTGSCKNREGIVRRSTAVPSLSSSLDELLLSVLVLFITPEAYLMIFVKVLTLTLLHHDYVSVVVWQNLSPSPVSVSPGVRSAASLARARHSARVTTGQRELSPLRAKHTSADYHLIPSQISCP